MKNKLILIGSIILIYIINLFSPSIDPYFYQILIFIGINIILASSLNLINGFTGQFSLGHAGFMAIGAYVSAAVSTYFGPFFISTFGTTFPGSVISFLIFLLIGGISAAIVGLIVGVPSLRLKGDYLALVTLGFGEIIRVIIQGLEVVGASQGFRGVYIYNNGEKFLDMQSNSDIGFTFFGIEKFTDFFWVYAIAAITIYVIYNLINSTYGRGYIAVKDDEIAAEAMGVNTTKYKVTAFVTGAFFAGLAGVLYAHYAQYINPEDFNFLRSIEVVVMVILGGMGSILGVIIAAVILTILPELLRGVSEYRMIIYALLLIIMMLTRPQGLFGFKLKSFKSKNKIPNSEK
ncbi:MAG TPA: branched-chain amino acid ABC transporter permease [Bacteroidetes bacterium]|nr:branched-chain amino acid ABC transporter permease [Ignavibacteria bacterium]HCA43315.1 branched-chain amino acid ABC transporter permease [Bacteroidota bacterium]